MLPKPILVTTQNNTSKQNVVPAAISKYVVFFALDVAMINTVVASTIDTCHVSPPDFLLPIEAIDPIHHDTCILPRIGSTEV